MKSIIISIFFLFPSLVTFGQNIINNDTTIRITISPDKSFDLKFEDWPSPGIAWYLPDSSYLSELSIKLIKQELKNGEKPIGGKYITTYNFLAR
jgi:predicted secreted protein